MDKQTKCVVEHNFSDHKKKIEKKKDIMNEKNYKTLFMYVLYIHLRLLQPWTKYFYNMNLYIKDSDFYLK